MCIRDSSNIQPKKLVQKKSQINSYPEYIYFSFSFVFVFVWKSPLLQVVTSHTSNLNLKEILAYFTLEIYVLALSYCIFRGLHIFFHDFMHLAPLFLHIADQLELCSAPIQIMFLSMDLEVCISLQIICQETHTTFKCCLLYTSRCV